MNENGMAAVPYGFIGKPDVQDPYWVLTGGLAVRRPVR